MQRDMDLVRELLLQIEADPSLDGLRFKCLSVENRDQREVAYIVTMLIENGFVTGQTAMEDPLVSGLSWKGHELLNDIRDPAIWKNVKENSKQLASVSIAFMWEMAKAEIRKRVGLS